MVTSTRPMPALAATCRPLTTRLAGGTIGATNRSRMLWSKQSAPGRCIPAMRETIPAENAP